MFMVKPPGFVQPAQKWRERERERVKEEGYLKPLGFVEPAQKRREREEERACKGRIWWWWPPSPGNGYRGEDDLLHSLYVVCVCLSAIGFQWHFFVFLSFHGLL